MRRHRQESPRKPQANSPGVHTLANGDPVSANRVESCGFISTPRLMYTGYKRAHRQSDTQTDGHTQRHTRIIYLKSTGCYRLAKLTHKPNDHTFGKTHLHKHNMWTAQGISSHNAVACTHVSILRSVWTCPVQRVRILSQVDMLTHE